MAKGQRRKGPHQEGEFRSFAVREWERCGLRPAGRVVVGHRDRRADLGGTSAACSWCHQPRGGRRVREHRAGRGAVNAAIAENCDRRREGP
jgi:hypothetical protein